MGENRAATIPQRQVELALRHLDLRRRARGPVRPTLLPHLPAPAWERAVTGRSARVGDLRDRTQFLQRLDARTTEEEANALAALEKWDFVEPVMARIAAARP